MDDFLPPDADWLGSAAGDLAFPGPGTRPAGAIDFPLTCESGGSDPERWPAAGEI